MYSHRFLLRYDLDRSFDLWTPLVAGLFMMRSSRTSGMVADLDTVLEILRVCVCMFEFEEDRSSMYGSRKGKFVLVAIEQYLSDRNQGLCFHGRDCLLCLLTVSEVRATSTQITMRDSVSSMNSQPDALHLDNSRTNTRRGRRYMRGSGTSSGFVRSLSGSSTGVD